jgi:anthranilate synthase component 1
VLESVKQAKIGNIVPVYKEIDEEIDVLEYFAKLSDYGKKKNSILIEDNEKSFGTANPCLKLTGKGIDFEIAPLNNLGKKVLNFIKKDFKFCDKAMNSKGKIIGKLTPATRDVSEQEKLKLKTHFDIIKAIAFKFKPTTKPFNQYCGLFGMFSDDFANQTEDTDEDLIKDPDYVFYFLDNMFVVDHKIKKTYFVANALITDDNKEKVYHECTKTINNYEKIISKKTPKGKKPKKKELKISYDVSKEEFLGVMKSLKRAIVDGNILYASLSRTTTTTYNAEPLDIFAQLKIAGDDTFYINDGLGMIIGSCGKANLVVKDEKSVELKILTTVRPRGKVKDEIEKDLDNKYEALLKVDETETSYNMMLADAARNDIARVSETGTRNVDKMFAVDKKDKFQNLTSTVKGTLKEDLDALHAYAAAMNPNVIQGVPKIKSMQVLGRIEKGKKGFSSGSVLYVTPDKDLQSFMAEPIRIKKDKAFISASCRVFHNSNDKEEFKAYNKKEKKLLDAIKSAGGLK